MKSKILKIAFSIVLLAGFISLQTFATLASEERKIGSINIEITDSENSLFLNEARVRTHLDEYGPLVGLYVNQISLSDIHNHLIAIPSVRHAVVYPTLQGELNIILTQKQPQARVHPQEGPDFYIDEEGLPMELDQVHSERVPIIHAKDANEAQIGMNFLKEIEGDRFWASLIDQIIITPSGEITLLPRLGAPLFLGGDLNVDEQKKNLITFYREQVRTGNLKNYTRIDLSYRDQVIATRYAHIN